MRDESNIWSVSFQIANKNYASLIIYCIYIVFLALLDEYFQSNYGKLIASIFASAILAIPAYLSVLFPMKPSNTIFELLSENTTYIRTFVLRTILLFLISLTPVFILFLFLLFMNWPTNAIILATVLSSLLLISLVFAKWGTMLPAIVTQDDSTFSRAGKRGKISFSYAFPRLLLACAFIGILQFIVILLSIILLDAGEHFFPKTGGIDFSLVFATLAGTILSGYQIIMISVILSRAYFLAEKAESQGDLNLASA